MKFKCPSCGFRSESQSPAFDVYYKQREGYCPEEKKWVKLGYDTTDARGNVVPYTADEITVLCVDNSGYEDVLSAGKTYVGIFENPLVGKNGHWILLNIDGTHYPFLPNRFVIINP